MMTREDDYQSEFMAVNLDEFVPHNHLRRRVKAKVDFTFVYDQVEDLYKDGGRPSIDPVRLVKMWLIGYLYGIPSERQLEQEVHYNLAYRWFLGIPLHRRVPDHSTLSQNRNGRLAGTTFFLDIFEGIVEQCKAAGLVEGHAVVSDSTHIGANASNDRKDVAVVTKAPSAYFAELEAAAQELEAAKQKERGGGGKRGRESKPQEPERQRTVVCSPTDPDARPLCRPPKPGGFHYLGHVTIEPSHGVILDAIATHADIGDHEPCVECIRRAKQRHDQITEAAADAGYDFIENHKGLGDLGITSYIPRRKPHSGTGDRFSLQAFRYDAEQDAYFCPGGKCLRFTHVKSASHQKVYAARTADCRSCPFRDGCLAPSAKFRTVKRAIYQDFADLAHERVGTPRYWELQRLRRIWCEGTFATMKACHCLGRAVRRGLNAVNEQLQMTATAVNMKRLATARG